MYKLIIDNEKVMEIDYAKSFKKRFFGLMGKKEFNGLLFKQRYSNKYLSSIHTCFMKVPIDLIYLDKKLNICELTTIYPWNLFIPEKNNTGYIIELPIMTIKRSNITLNSKVELKKM